MGEAARSGPSAEPRGGYSGVPTAPATAHARLGGNTLRVRSLPLLVLVLGLLLAACSDEAALEAAALEEATLLEAAALDGAPAAEYIIVAKGNLKKDLAAVAAANGDSLRIISQGAGLAAVTTGNPNAYAKFGAVVPDVHVQWIDPIESVALEVDAGSPPFSDSEDFYFNLQWGHTAVGAVEAWEAGVRGAGVTVAVLDTGFDLDHPDLEPNISPLSTDFTGEGLQYIVDDTFSHGTHTAGTIGAVENGFGTIGVAPDVDLLLVKVLSDITGSGSFSDVMSGIIYAADHGADIINMSLGAVLDKSGFWSDPNTPDDPSDDVWVSAREVNELKNAMAAAVRYATQKGVLVVASAGNSAIDFDGAGAVISLPASAPGVLRIGASAPTGWIPQLIDGQEPAFDVLASYSNYGRSHLSFSAPGGDAMYEVDVPDEDLSWCNVSGVVNPCYVFDLVFSTGNGGWYWSGGTSMAAPHVAGVAALILSEHGGSGSLKPAQLEAQLRSRAKAATGQRGNDPHFGMGLVHTGY